LLAVVGCAAISSTSGCFVTRPPAGAAQAPAATPPPAAVSEVGAELGADAIPKAEPKSRYGNPPFYDVFGKRYYVLSSSADYVERGVASWYGPGFHQVKTSTGELYDMYAMSAAHRTLPLPAYVRVTNLQNGRSVVVRVNDRGPFVGNRIIDLSYTAAARLDMLRDGTAMVEVRSIDTGAPPPAADAAPLAATPTAPAAPAAPAAVPNTSASAATPVLFVQAGAFADPANAARLAAKLRGGDYGRIFVRDDVIAGRKMYRVRIGPVADVQSFDRIYAALERDGVHDAHLAMD
jgi:rare lipoprotein A